jgi:hypothetical protein
VHSKALGALDVYELKTTRRKERASLRVSREEPCCRRSLSSSGSLGSDSVAAPTIILAIFVFCGFVLMVWVGRDSEQRGRHMVREFFSLISRPPEGPARDSDGLICTTKNENLAGFLPTRTSRPFLHYRTTRQRPA